MRSKVTSAGSSMALDAWRMTALIELTACPKLFNERSRSAASRASIVFAGCNKIAVNVGVAFVDHALRHIDCTLRKCVM
jgi:hypothetical protein